MYPGGKILIFLVKFINVLQKNEKKKKTFFLFFEFFQYFQIIQFFIECLWVLVAPPSLPNENSEYTTEFSLEGPIDLNLRNVKNLS